MIAVGSASLSAPEGEDVTGELAEVYKPKRRIPIGAIFGAVWMLTILVLTILATYFPSAVPFIRDYDTRVKVNGRTQSYGLGPGWTAWWGLEKSSYDVFSRCIYAAKVTLTISLGATLIGLVLGGLLGMMAGYFRGWPDRIISVVTDSLQAVPFLVLALVLVIRVDDWRSRYDWLSWFSRTWSLTLTLGVIVIAPIARLVRAQTLTLREREFVLASRSLGAKRSRIMVKEILPNVIPAMVTDRVHAARPADRRRGRAGLPRAERRAPGDVGQDDRQRHERPGEGVVGDDVPVHDGGRHARSRSTSSATSSPATSTSARRRSDERSSIDQPDAGCLAR